MMLEDASVEGWQLANGITFACTHEAMADSSPLPEDVAQIVHIWFKGRIRDRWTCNTELHMYCYKNTYGVHVPLDAPVVESWAHALTYGETTLAIPPESIIPPSTPASQSGFNSISFPSAQSINKIRLRRPFRRQRSTSLKDIRSIQLRLGPSTPRYIANSAGFHILDAFNSLETRRRDRIIRNFLTRTEHITSSERERWLATTQRRVSSSIEDVSGLFTEHNAPDNFANAIRQINSLQLVSPTGAMATSETETMTIARNDNSLLERPRLLLQDSTALAKEDSLMIDLTSEICYELTRPPLPLSSTHVFTEVKDLVWFDSESGLDVTAAAVVAELSSSHGWPNISVDRAARYRREVEDCRQVFHDEGDMQDTAMVSEYADEIFDYMCDQEESMMPDADYITRQNELNWTMRQTLIDWLIQLHSHYKLVPETLWIAVNILDRFLTKTTVSIVKFQLVGIVAMFIAAKYEEVTAPSAHQLASSTDGLFTKKDVSQGEKFVLKTLEYEISQYCSPYNWMRKTSKADDYDVQTRTLSKFLTEVTLLDYRFLRVKSSLVAAVGMYTARRMLGRDWGTAFVFLSKYTEEQLLHGFSLLMENLGKDGFSEQYVYRKYASRKFLKVSMFAIKWATAHLEKAGDEKSTMMLDD